MTAIPVPLAVTEETVILSRAGWAEILARLENAQDLAVHDRAMAEHAAAGGFVWTAEEVGRMLDDELHPIALLRARGGMARTALATASGVSGAYIAEIEGHKKPGSVKAMAAIAKALGVAIEVIVA